MKTKTKSTVLVLTLAFLSLLAAINAVLFNIAFPNISRDLHLASSQVSWIAIGYSMVVAIGSIIYGKLADAISLRKLFLIGIGLFILGSLLGHYHFGAHAASQRRLGFYHLGDGGCPLND